MKKIILKQVFIFLIAGAALSSCHQMFLQPKFSYLNKVPAMARAEADTVMAHIIRYQESKKRLVIDSSVVRAEIPKTFDTTEHVKPTLPGPVKFSLNETKRIITHDLRPHSFGRKSDSKASAGGINGWVLGVLVFFGSLFLFALVIFWAIQEQMGCLASGLAVFALLFEIWLVMFVLM